jgi:hypothetical protein
MDVNALVMNSNKEKNFVLHEMKQLFCNFFHAYQDFTKSIGWDQSHFEIKFGNITIEIDLLVV